MKQVELDLNEDKNVDYSYVKELINHKENAVIKRQNEINIQDPGEEEGPSFNASNQDLISNLIIHNEKKGEEEAERLLEKDKGDMASRHSASRMSKGGGSEMNIKGAPSYKLQ